MGFHHILNPPCIYNNTYSFKFNMKKKQNGGPLNHNMLHPVISNMISLLEPLIEAKTRQTNIQVYDMFHWFVSMSVFS